MKNDLKNLVFSLPLILLDVTFGQTEIILTGNVTMLEQFQRLYPTGCLKSELVQIYNGKYIIRTSVEIEGTIRATGMAADESIEIAEDKARQRAIMVMPIANLESMPATTSNNAIAKSAEDSHQEIKSINSDGIDSDRLSIPPTPTPTTQVEETKPKIAETSKSKPKPPEPENPPLETIDPSPQIPEIFSPTAEITNLEIPTPTTQTISEPTQFPTNPEPTLNFDQPSSNVTPFTPRNSPVTYSEPSSTAKAETKTTASKRGRKKNAPVDLSGIIAQTDVEMQRLGWTPEQGREYLIQTYKKRGRTLLDEQELIDFLNYLKSQPTPSDNYAIDPLAGF